MPPLANNSVLFESCSTRCAEPKAAWSFCVRAGENVALPAAAAAAGAALAAAGAGFAYRHHCPGGVANFDRTRHTI